MKQWVHLVCGLLVALLGVGLLVLGLSIPAYVASVSEIQLEMAATEADTINDRAVVELALGRPSIARNLLLASGYSESEMTELLRPVFEANPLRSMQVGGPSPFFEAYLKLAGKAPDEVISLATFVAKGGQPCLPLLANRFDRQALTDFLEQSGSPLVRHLLATRQLNGYARFYAVTTAAGAPLDASVLLTAMLVQGGEFPATLALELNSLANASISGDLTALSQLETVYLATLTLANHTTFSELAALAKTSSDWETWARKGVWLRQIQERALANGHALAFSMLWLHGDASAVLGYVQAHPQTAFDDLTLALSFGEAGLRELVASDLPMRQPSAWEARYLPEIRWLAPQWLLWLAKLGALLLAGLCLAGTFGCLMKQDSKRSSLAMLPRYLTPGCVTLLLALVVIEPELLSQAVVEPGKLFLAFELSEQTATMGGVANLPDTGLDPTTLYVLLGFFAMQLVIYVICLTKTAAIRKGAFSASMKLKLLDNEEQLFDAGLYVGLAGTVISLLMLALGIVQASLVAAYASTLFGILFVAALKIFHVRPLRRRLLLECRSPVTREETNWGSV